MRRFLALLCLAIVPLIALAQENEGPSIDWTDGPATVDLGERLARLDLPAGYRFADGEATRQLMQLMGNPPNDTEVGLLTPTDDEQGFFIVFEFDDVGFVKDEDKDEIDADELFESISQGTEAANEYRKENGFTALHLTRWNEEPHYDETSHNLVWALEARDEGDDGRVSNYNVRVLGRQGYLSVTLVTDPQQLAAVKPEVERILAGLSYHEGSRYADFVSSDKIAAVGLTALIAGGAGAAAAKLGLFAVLAKFLGKAWKLLIVGVAALGSAVKRLFGGRRSAAAPPPSV